MGRTDGAGCGQEDAPPPRPPHAGGDEAWEGNAKGGSSVKIGIMNNPTLSEMMFTFHGTVVKGNDDTGGQQHYKRSRNWIDSSSSGKGRGR